MTADVPFTAPLEIPPPPAGHAFRWRRVLALLREVRSASDPVKAGVELFDAVGGMDGERSFQRFAADREGRRMLQLQPDLVARLGDRGALAALPEQSLGRAYLAFAEENGFAADGLVQKSREVERAAVDPYRRWYWDRHTVSHDLWHVLTGCPTTPEGEGRLLWFSCAQQPSRGLRVILMLIGYNTGLDFMRHWNHLRCWWAGKRARDLSLAPWEELLHWPLVAVRARFGVRELMT